MKQYKIIPHQHFKRQYKKLNPQRKVDIENAILAIVENPFHENLAGNLEGLQKFRMRTNPEYRIIYAVYSCEPLETCRFDICQLSDEKENCLGVIDLISVATREQTNDFYNKPRKEIKRWLRE